MEGDPEAAYAHYVLHKFHILPSAFLAWSRNEKAFVMASVDEQVKAEKKQAARIKR